MNEDAINDPARMLHEMHSVWQVRMTGKGPSQNVHPPLFPSKKQNEADSFSHRPRHAYFRVGTRRVDHPRMAADP